jgi:hypothetical protein
VTGEFHADYAAEGFGGYPFAMRWLAEHVSKASALRWSDHVDAAIRQVLKNPHPHLRAHEADELGIDLREALFGKKPNVYRLLFTISGSTVFIHFVHHGARDWLTKDDL